MRRISNVSDLIEGTGPLTVWVAERPVWVVGRPISVVERPVSVVGRPVRVGAATRLGSGATLSMRLVKCNNTILHDAVWCYGTLEAVLLTPKIKSCCTATFQQFCNAVSLQHSK